MEFPMWPQAPTDLGARQGTVGLLAGGSIPGVLGRQA